ncbi:MAG: spermidine synthase [Panacagrimonas sp.]
MPQLLKRLRNGQYAKPFVLDDGEYRQLHFGLRFTQSRMSLKAPDALSLAYTRKMMAFLLFQPEPQHVVIVGLGGGSLTKFCYRQLPRTRITTVEIDQAVIDLSTLFKVPRPNARLRIVHADGAEYFATTHPSADVVLVDGCDQQGIAPALCEERFYASVRACLRPNGVLIVNLVGAVGRSDTLIRSIARVFDGQVLVLPVSVGGNRIALAFCDPAWPLDWPEIQQRAVMLGKHHDLDLAGFAKRLAAGARKTLDSPSRGRGRPRSAPST